MDVVNIFATPQLPIDQNTFLYKFTFDFLMDTSTQDLGVLPTGAPSLVRNGTLELFDDSTVARQSAGAVVRFQPERLCPRPMYPNPPLSRCSARR